MRREADDDEWEDSTYMDHDEDYGDDSDEEPTRDCPCCGVEMLEVCIQCPSCGQYLSREDVHERSRPLWVVLVVILCLASIFFWMF